MNLKVVTWNVRRAGYNSPVWNIIEEINPDLIILQEVISFPQKTRKTYSILSAKATKKNGNSQIFSSAILCKGNIEGKMLLESKHDWVNKELNFFSGNLLACSIKIKNLPRLKVVSVYSPAWPINDKKLKDINVSNVKLTHSPKLWCTEILWSSLKNENDIKNEHWIVAGDFNSSVTFDFLWGNKPRGNQEIVKRMNALGLIECLKYHNGNLVPTFKNPKGGKMIHQLDHMYVSKPLLASMLKSFVGDSTRVFDQSMSDHLPIITDFQF